MGIGRRGLARNWRRLAMADVIYIGIGVLFFILMGLYAHACERL
jgi:hypothetical protein